VKVTALFQKLKNFLFAEKDHSPRPLRPLVDVTGVEHRFIRPRPLRVRGLWLRILRRLRSNCAP